MTIQYRCPQCGGVDLTVRVETDAVLEQRAGGPPVATDLPPGADLYWDDESWMTCSNCEHAASAHLFEQE